MIRSLMPGLAALLMVSLWWNPCGAFWAGTLRGSATCREHIALPPDAVFEAVQEDVSRADAPAQVPGRSRLDSAGRPPFKFEIVYDDAAVQQGRRYTVRPTVTYQGRRPGDSCDSRVAETPLRGTYWKLVRLGDDPVHPAKRQREAHLVLDSHEPRVSGSGGCNRLSGRFELDGDRLRFGRMASTRIACPGGMEQERRFLATLEKVERCRIRGDHLDVLDASGFAMARFEAVDLR